MRDLLAALRKDLLLQWRGRAQVIAIFAFGAAALLLFSFAIGPDSAALREHAAGFLWLGLLLASTLALAESFEREMEEQALEGLLLLPASPRGLYYGKALANWAHLALLGVALVPVMVVLYDAGTLRLFSLVGVILLGTAGLQHPRESQARGDVHEMEVAVRLGGRRRSRGCRQGAGERQDGEAEEDPGAYLAGATCWAQAASTFFHSASRPSAFGSRASMASAREEPRNACLAFLVTTT